MKRLLRITCMAGVLSISYVSLSAQAAPSSAAGGGDASSALSGWSFGIAPYTHHFSEAKKEHDFEPDVEKHKYVWLLNAEKQLDDQYVAGFAVFNNSFGQFSQYAYVGRNFRPWDAHPELFFKITGGVIHGYKYPFNKKIPFNNKNGWGITAIPGVGWNFTPEWGAQVNLLGTSAVMFQVNYTFK